MGLCRSSDLPLKSSSTICPGRIPPKDGWWKLDLYRRGLWKPKVMVRPAHIYQLPY